MSSSLTDIPVAGVKASTVAGTKSIRWQRERRERQIDMQTEKLKYFIRTRITLKLTVLRMINSDVKRTFTPDVCQ